MSDVRLSNASPVERVDARQQDNVRPSVRRNLFGRPDPDEIRRDAENSEREEVQRFRETYDFDLVEGRPLAPRSYDWVQDDDAPEFYSRQPHSRPRGSPGDSNRLDNDGGERPSRSSDGGDDDDNDDKSDGAGSQTITAAEERPGKPEGVSVCANNPACYLCAMSCKHSVSEYDWSTLYCVCARE
uniref:Cyclin-dependent kinase inhibitor 1B n=1 Tax=Oreochromis aureus TaxID=47969 RepID=A0A668TCQ9_OREAU